MRMFPFTIIPAVTNLAGTILKPHKGGSPVFEPRAKARGGTLWHRFKIFRYAADPVLEVLAAKANQ